MAGTIRYVILAKDDSVETEADPEIFLRVAGRGRIAWRGHTGRDRSGAAILLPPRSGLTVSGHLRALRVAFPGLPVSVPVGPVSDVLVNLLCSRAWRAPLPIAEASLALARLLIAEEVGQNANGADRPDTAS